MSDDLDETFMRFGEEWREVRYVYCKAGRRMRKGGMCAAG